MWIHPAAGYGIVPEVRFERDGYIYISLGGAGFMTMTVDEAEALADQLLVVARQASGGGREHAPTRSRSVFRGPSQTTGD